MTESLAVKTHRELRNNILSGKIPSGSRLIESTLAKQLNVSRTPIREALRQLESEGLLYSIPRAGYIVEEMSSQDVLDLFKARAAIEELTAQWATIKITDLELSKLKTNLDYMESAIVNKSFENFTDLDVEFHSIIYKASRNKTLFQICQMLSDHTLKFRQAMIHLPEISQKTLQGHIKIYDALKRKNADEVSKSIHNHLQLAQEDIVILLEELRHDTY